MENTMSPNRQNSVDCFNGKLYKLTSFESKVKYINDILNVSSVMKSVITTRIELQEILFFENYVEKTLSELKDKRRIKLRDEIYKIQEQGSKAPDELLKEYAELSKNDIIINKLEG